MRLTVLGGCGAWPAAGQACSGYLVEHDGFRLLVDPGYAVVPRLLEIVAAAEVSAVLVSHGHPDHCADLNPLLRARTFIDDPAPELPVYALPGALDAVLALDRPASLAGSYALTELAAGDRLEIGPFRVDSRLTPHHLPNAAVRLTAGGTVLAYTGDSGPCPDLLHLARDADLYLAEASYPERVPQDLAPYLSSAAQAGRTAARAGARRLLLTHLMPGTAAADALRAAGEAGAAERGGSGAGLVEIAEPGLVVRLD